MTVGVLNIIPFFGMIIAIVLSAFLVFIAAPEKLLVFILVMLIIEQIDANIIAPKILGNSAGISSLGVIIAVTLMGSYFGVIGMIVGVPIFATITIIINELVEEKLTKKNLPTSADDYFPAYSLVDPHEHHDKLFTRIFGNIIGKFSKFFKRFSKKNNSKKVAHTTKDNNNNEQESTAQNGENNDE